MVKEKSEFGLIEWIRRQGVATGAGGAGGNLGVGDGVQVGIGDDMAVLELDGEQVLVTCDMLLEGVHFELETAESQVKKLSVAKEEPAVFKDYPPASLEQVGYKAMACSLSDCAAMAVEPWVAVVAVALRRGMSMAEAQQLHAGLQDAGQKYGCPLVGGDTTSWDERLAINVTMLGRARWGEPVLRSGAQVGDVVMVTGELGGSRRGRHLSFEPRVAEAKLLRELVELHAMIDVSDGLSIDLDHVCQESGVAAVIEAGVVPISEPARRSDDPLGAALGDGEDFELLFCVGPGQADELMASWAKRSQVRLSRIGEIIPTGQGQGRLFLQNDIGERKRLAISGWEHFK
ncbi:MAG: thiamine-monophosphate kinase [Sedimentisphaerales bacterium]|nr:thiamine-monophosphate kinase [Sedimentisphaerales bacterium]